MKSKILKVTAALAVTNFFLISHVSKYRFDDLQSYNWDIAVMLTPFGIIKNLLVMADSYLAPYYHLKVQLSPEHSFFPLVVFIVFQVILSFACLEILKKARR